MITFNNHHVMVLNNDFIRFRNLLCTGFSSFPKRQHHAVSIFQESKNTLLEIILKKFVNSLLFRLLNSQSQFPGSCHALVESELAEVKHVCAQRQKKRGPLVLPPILRTYNSLSLGVLDVLEYCFDGFQNFPLDHDPTVVCIL